MLIVERQKRLLDLLRDRRAAQLEDLARELDVSGSTVRRDLDALEKTGVLERTHGGAVYLGAEALGDSGFGDSIDEPDNSPSLSTRMKERVAQKQAIGAYAASLVEPQMTLLLDGGSTVIYAARLIQARPIQIVTNSLSICQTFRDDDQVEVLMVGGNLYPRTEVTLGPIATGTLADLHADMLFCSFAGIYGDAAYNINLEMARVEQVMMQQAARSVMLMDSSKFGRKSLVQVAGLNEFDRIVTDDGVDSETRERMGDQLVAVPVVSG